MRQESVLLTQKKRKSGIYKIYNPQKGDQSKDLTKTKPFIIQIVIWNEEIQDQFHKDKKNWMRNNAQSGQYRGKRFIERKRPIKYVRLEKPQNRNPTFRMHNPTSDLARLMNQLMAILIILAISNWLQYCQYLIDHNIDDWWNLFFQVRTYTWRSSLSTSRF